MDLDIDLSTISQEVDVWFDIAYSNDTWIKFCIKVDLKVSPKDKGVIVTYHKAQLITTVNMEQNIPNITSISATDEIETPESTGTNAVNYELEAF